MLGSVTRISKKLLFYEKSFPIFSRFLGICFRFFSYLKYKENWNNQNHQLLIESNWSNDWWSGQKSTGQQRWKSTKFVRSSGQTAIGSKGPSRKTRILAFSNTKTTAFCLGIKGPIFIFVFISPLFFLSIYPLFSFLSLFLSSVARLRAGYRLRLPDTENFPEIFKGF